MYTHFIMYFNRYATRMSFISKQASRELCSEQYETVYILYMYTKKKKKIQLANKFNRDYDGIAIKYQETRKNALSEVL